MDALIQDLRYALRQLRRYPGFAAVVVCTLGLGIGANTAVFSVLDAAILRALPVEEPERLVHVQTQRPAGRVNANLSYPLFDAIREGARSFTDVVAMAERPVGLGTGEATVRAVGEFVSAGYFGFVGVEPVLGRGFTAAEHAAGAPVLVLGHASWRDRFGRDPGVLGATVALNGRPFTVVGVAGEAFPGLVRGQRAEFWAPLRSFPLLTPDGSGIADLLFADPGVSWLNVVGRLRPGATLEQARSEAAVLDERLRQEGVRVDDESMRLDRIAGGLAWNVRDLATPLRLLMAVVGVVLLIACANVAGLLLARASGRRRELAVRRSLGAGRGRLVRQLLTESVVLALAGAVVGLLFATWLADLLVSFRPPTGDALVLEVGPDLRVLGFTGALALAATLLFGTLPALKATGGEPARALKDDASAARRPGRRYGLREALVAGQVGLSLVLLVGAGLLLRSLGNLRSVDLAFAPRSVLLVSTDLRARSYEPGPGLALYRAAAEGVQGLPGVESAAWASVVHPDPAGERFEDTALEDAPGAPEAGAWFDVNVVSPAYFETLRMPLLRGRAFRPTDGPGVPRVAIVNRSMAERYWPGLDPIGRRIFLDGPDSPETAARIVGIVPDSRYRDVRERDRPVAYFPLAQSFESAVTLLVRGPADPLALAASVRDEIRRLDPGIPLYDVRSLEEHVRLATSHERLAARLTAVFGSLALLLAAVGLYGILSYFVGRRAREIGVRMALGAERRDIVRLVLRGAAAVVGAGLALGAPAAVGAGRLVGGFLYEVEVADPASFALALATLGAAGLVAAWLPARRAAAVDPSRTLRQE